MTQNERIIKYLTRYHIYLEENRDETDVQVWKDNFQKEMDVIKEIIKELEEEKKNMLSMASVNDLINIANFALKTVYALDESDPGQNEEEITWIEEALKKVGKELGS